MTLGVGLNLVFPLHEGDNGSHYQTRLSARLRQEKGDRLNTARRRDAVSKPSD